MANKIKTGPKVSDKKLNRLLIEQKLEEALSDLKLTVGKKRFQKNIRKAGRLLYKGFSKKTLDNFRKSTQTNDSTGEIKDDTTLLIEELP